MVLNVTMEMHKDQKNKHSAFLSIYIETIDNIRYLRPQLNLFFEICISAIPRSSDFQLNHHVNIVFLFKGFRALNGL